ncbi:hypothetical protein [Rubrivivax albus]|uniref:hypothetical protein n=1 Tax=Rubrivivax albus TaxID=2499835 RepID=UPI0035BF59E2
MPLVDLDRRACRTSPREFLGEHWRIAVLALTSLFVASAAGTVRVFKRKGRPRVVRSGPMTRTAKGHTGQP